MADGFKIADGYVDIEADAAGALKDVKAFLREVDTVLDTAEDHFEKSGEESGEKFGDGTADGFERSAPKFFRGIDGRLRDAKGRFVKAGKEIEESVSRGLGSHRRHGMPDLIPGDRGRRGIFGRLMDGAKDFFQHFAQGFTQAFSGAMDQAKTIWKNASEFFEQIGNVAGGIGTILQIGAIASLIPVILALGGALMDLSAALLALPAAGAVAVSAILPLIIAFKGFGTAVSAGLSGDTEKFNEALKKLAPNARRVAKEFVALAPLLKSIKASVQNAFFAPLIGASKQLIPLLTTVRGGFTSIAAAAGNVFRRLIDTLTSPRALETFNALFESTTRIMQRLEPTLSNIADGLLSMIKPALPFVERLAGAFQNMAAAFAGWADANAKNGNITRWLERAWEVGSQLWDLMKALGATLGTIFGQTGDEGSGFLLTLTDQLNKFNEYLKSDQGKKFLDDLVDTIRAVEYAIGGLFTVVGAIGTAWLAMKSAGIAVWHFLQDFWQLIKDTGSSIGGFFTNLGSSIWGFLSSAGKAIGDFFVGIGHWVADAYRQVSVWGGQLLDWLGSLPGKIGAFFSALPGWIADFFMWLGNTVLYGIGYVAGLLVKFLTIDIPAWFTAAWSYAKDTTTRFLELIWSYVTAWPGRIMAGLSWLGTGIANLFTSAWTSAKNSTITLAEAIWLYVSNLPRRIGGAVSAVVGIVGGFFADAWNRAKTNTSSGVNDVIAWVKRLPGMAGAALSGAKNWLVETGKDMLRGLVNGITDLLGWAIDRAKAAAIKIKDGFLKALDVNSPSQVMRKEVGRQLLPGVAQGIDDTMPRMQRYLGATGEAIAGGFNPTVNVGGPNVKVDGPRVVVMLDGKEIAAGVILEPARVAAATDEGRRQRNWAFSPRAKR